MSIDKLIFLLCLAVLWWAYSGYFIFLYITSKKDNGEAESKEELPGISIIVPLYNEEKVISQKLKNLIDLDYPKNKIEIIIADGLSNDNTEKIVKEKIIKAPFIKFIQTNRKGKILQINSVLQETKYDIIINTDADGILNKSAVYEIAGLINGKKADIVGIYTVPINCSEYEKHFWRVQNSIRLLESRSCLSSTVVAICYGFRKNILKEIPNNVIADDVYIPFYANTLGYKTVYSARGKAFESRSAKNISELMKHKSRKSNADLKEIFRFIKFIPIMRWKWKCIFITKMLQLIIGPLFSVFFILLLIKQLTDRSYLFILISLFFVLISIVVSSRILENVSIEKGKKNFLWDIKMFLITNYILIKAIIVYPFYKQTSSYAKLK